MAFRVTVLDMETGEERVFVRNACGVICAAVMPKEGEEDKYDGVAAASMTISMLNQDTTRGSMELLMATARAYLELLRE